MYTTAYLLVSLRTSNTVLFRQRIVVAGKASGEGALWGKESHADDIFTVIWIVTLCWGSEGGGILLLWVYCAGGIWGVLGLIVALAGTRVYKGGILRWQECCFWTCTGSASVLPGAEQSMQGWRVMLSKAANSSDNVTGILPSAQLISKVKVRLGWTPTACRSISTVCCSQDSSPFPPAVPGETSMLDQTLPSPPTITWSSSDAETT